MDLNPVPELDPEWQELEAKYGKEVGKEIAAMDAMPEAEVDRILAELEAKCAERLPFASNFFEDEVQNLPDAIMFGPPSQHPRLLAAEQYLSWLASDAVYPTLKAWKVLVADNMSLRKQLMNGFHADEVTSSGTIDCLVSLCCQSKNHKKPSETDAWDATAFFAAKLVKDNDYKGSPICGMASKGQVSWCYCVMIRLLITAYTDMLESKDSYFGKLLGGPKVKKLSKKEFKRDMMRIDNRPLNKENEIETQ